MFLDALTSHLKRSFFQMTLGSLFFVLPGIAFGAPGSLTYQGRILKTDGTALEFNNVSFIFEITDPSGACVVYREQASGYNMTNSNGVFDVPIGKGTVLFPTSGSFGVLDAFNNSASLACYNSATPFNPAVDDIRKLRVQFHDGAGWQTISPDAVIRSVPFAGYSLAAQKLGSHTSTDFVLKSEVNNATSCDSGSFLTWDATTMKFGCSGVSGASGGTVKTVSGSAGSSPYLSVSADTVNPVITLNVGTVAGTVAAGNDSRFTDSRAPNGPAGGVLTGTYPNPGLADNSVTNSKINDGAVSTSKLFANPGVNRLVMTDSSTGSNLAPLSCSAGQLLTWNVATGWQCANQSSLAVGSASVSTNFSGSLAGDVTGTQGATSVDKIKGYPLDFAVAPTSGQVLKYNGTQWAPAADNNGGGTVTSVSASAPLSVTTPTTTPALSIAKATTSTDGYLSAVDWNIFNGKQNALGFTPLNPANNLSELTATASTARTNLGLGTAAVKNVAASGDAAATEVVLGNDSRMTNSRTPTGAAGGDLTGTYPNPTLANVVTAGTGTKVTYDAKGRVTSSTTLSATDIPSLDWSKITTGKPTSLAGYGIVDSLVLNAGGTPSIQTGTDATKPASPSAGAIYFATDTKIIYQYNSGWVAVASSSGSGGTITSLTSDVTASGSGAVSATVNSVGGSSATNIHNAELAANAATNVNTASTIIKRDASGNFAAGNATLGSVILKDSGSNTATLQAPTTITSSYVLKLPTALGSANQVLTTDASGNLSWTTPAVTSGVSVTSPITNSGTASAPNIGIQAANGSQNGYLSSADWTTFNTKQTNSLTSANIWVGDATNKAAAVVPGGDVTMTNAGAFTVTKIRGISVSGTSPSAAGQVLKYDGTTQYAPGFISVADIKATITPFGGAFAAANCTAAQTLTYQSATDTFICQNLSVSASNFSNQAQNTFLAAPSTGGAGAPTFRTIAAADLPAGGYDSTYFKNGGNSFGTTTTIGTNDANALGFRTNNTVKMTLTSAGNMGVGISNPMGKLVVSNGGAQGFEVWPGGWPGGATGIMAYDRSASAYTGMQFDAASISLAPGGLAANGLNVIASGNVGIGTTTPGFKLDINGGSASINARIAGSNADGPVIRFENSSASGGRIYHVGSTDSTSAAGNGFSIYDATALASRLVINPSGNVGINATSPARKLHVLYNVSGADDGIIIENQGNAGANLSLKSSGAGGREFMWISTGSANSAGAGVLGLYDNTGGGYRMVVNSSGNVGIGTTTPSEMLEVNGNVKAASYLYTSDARLKKDIITLPNALAKVLQLRGVNFVWKSNDEKTVGFIAQEVEKVYPELVHTDAKSGYKSVQYGNIVAILVEALKEEHQQRVNAQRGIASVQQNSEDRLQKLEKENQDLKARLERLEKLLSDK